MGHNVTVRKGRPLNLFMARQKQRTEMLQKMGNQIFLNPPLFLLLGFAAIILLGSIFLSLPFVTQTGQSIGYLNALFTAASASCVTGLTVVNTAKTFNFAGKLIILILIQVGGLGIMTFATLIPMIIGQKIGLVTRQILKEQLNVESLTGIVRLLRYVLTFTFIVEGIGVILLGIRFIPMFGLKKGTWYAIFHSISAFCNAGFDVMGDSFYPLRDDILINVTLMALVIIGGLGFFVTQEIIRKRKFKLLSTHAKIVLLMSGILILVGALGFLVLEFNNPLTLAQEKTHVKITQSFFQSVVARTAGFYSVPIPALRDSTAFLLILLMFIGGSPGSTAGGLKTTTFGVLIITTISTLKGQAEPGIFNKHIPIRTIRKALSLVVVSIGLISLITFILTMTEKDSFINLLFETVSAYGTVGTSRGITPSLTPIGKLLIIVMMYSGRLGPLTLGMAISNRVSPSHIRYPEANITIG